MVKKAQGALEFLMTYGWAFLVILIMIGALAYFGILNPTRFLPERCDFGTQVLCKKDQFIVSASNTGTIIASVTNNYGSNINISNVNAIPDVPTTGHCVPCFDTNGDAQCTAADDNLTTGIIWNAGASQSLVIDCSAGANYPTGEKIKVPITYDWYSTTAGPSFSKTQSGELYAAVQ